MSDRKKSVASKSRRKFVSQFSLTALAVGIGAPVDARDLLGDVDRKSKNTLKSGLLTIDLIVEELLSLVFSEHNFIQGVKKQKQGLLTKFPKNDQLKTFFDRSRLNDLVEKEKNFCRKFFMQNFNEVELKELYEIRKSQVWIKFNKLQFENLSINGLANQRPYRTFLRELNVAINQNSKRMKEAVSS